jgi:phosphotransferase system HPr-like phosphotransfer protein
MMHIDDTPPPVDAPPHVARDEPQTVGELLDRLAMQAEVDFEVTDPAGFHMRHFSKVVSAVMESGREATLIYTNDAGKVSRVNAAGMIGLMQLSIQRSELFVLKVEGLPDEKSRELFSSLLKCDGFVAVEVSNFKRRNR